MLIRTVAPNRVHRRPVSGRPLRRSALDELFRGLPQAPMAAPAEFAPRVDVTEQADDLVLTAELPGIPEGEFEVIVDSDVITLKGEKKVGRPESADGIHRAERSSGAFARSFRIPFEVDPDSVTAALAAGVLTVTVPKPPEKQVRNVPIATA